MKTNKFTGSIKPYFKSELFKIAEKEVGINNFKWVIIFGDSVINNKEFDTEEQAQEYDLSTLDAIYIAGIIAIKERILRDNNMQSQLNFEK